MQNQVSFKIILTSLVLILGSLFLGYSFYFGQDKQNSIDLAERSDVFEEIKENKDLKLADELYKKGDYRAAFTKLEEVLESNDLSSNTKVYESTELYKIASQVAFDRDAGLKSYYDFFRNENNSNLNRAYAAIMAAQNTIANNDAKRLVSFLNEDEVRGLKEISHDEVLYALDKKIFAIYPFPLSATRIAIYEINQINKYDKDYKQKVESIQKKYLFRYDENIQEMLKYEGLRHLIPNSLGSKSLLENILEDAKIIGATTTTKTLEQAYEYALVYSGKVTQHFLLITFLDHEVKINNQDKIDKLLKVFRYEGNETGEVLSNFVKNRFKAEKDFQKFYPNIHKKYNSDSEFKKIFNQVIK